MVTTWTDPDERTSTLPLIVVLALCAALGLLFGLVVLGSQEVVCAVNDTPGDRPSYCEQEQQP